MNKKEVLEIRKLLQPDSSIIRKISTCYVDGDKNIVCKNKTAFHAISEEEAFKYCDIFKQTLSGTLGKNLLNMDFPLNEEMPGGKQEFLLKLRDSHLENDALLDAFYEKIIASYPFTGNYYITLILATYDVPGQATDGTEMFDASEYVYEFLLCSICPVNLSKAGLGYNIDKNNIEERVRDWIVDPAVKGFLFPVFNDRNTDIHSVLYYSKKPEDLQPEFIDEMLGSTMPLSAGSQQETFNTIIQETLGEECDYEVVKNIHETLTEMIEGHKDAPEPLALTKHDVKQLLTQSGVSDEKMEVFEKEYAQTAGDKTQLLASNIASVRKFNIETPDIVIKVNPDRTDLVETRIIDGKECLVITVNDHIEVNGVNVKTIRNR